MTTKHRTRQHPYDKKDTEWIAPVDRIETLRARFWTWLTIYAEGKWLEANGWIRVRNGWLLPNWHPKKIRASTKDWAKQPTFTVSRSSWSPQTAIPGLGEPYEQNHAANSQRAHTNIRTVQGRHPRGQKAPAFPPYIKGWATLPITQTLGLAIVSAQLLAGDHWSRHLLFLLAVLLFCVSFCISHASRREWELDWAEERLNRRTNGIHGPN